MSKKSQTHMRVRMIVWIFAALLFAAESWAACTSGTYRVSAYSSSIAPACSQGSCGLSTQCSLYESCQTSVSSPDSRYQNCKPYSFRSNSGTDYCSSQYPNAPTCFYASSSYLVDILTCSTFCDSQCEGDSLACVKDGGTWAEYENSACGKRCITNACTSADTANLLQQINKCDSLGGESTLGLSNAGDRCDITGFCDLCNGDAYKQLVAALKKRCCELGHLPDTVTCGVADASSATKEFNLSSVECSPAKPEVKITESGETYRDGCDPEPGSSTSSGESSNSNDGSSSSECIGFDCPPSSSGTGNADLEDIKDSLHKIIIYDSTTASNTMDMVNYLYDIKTCLETGTCGAGAPVDYSDSLHQLIENTSIANHHLFEIANKDLSVQVSGGLTAEKQAELVSNIGKVADSVAKYGLTTEKQAELVSNIEYVADSAAKYGVVNGEKLDSIVSALHQLGADTIAHRLDSMRNGILQEVADSLATVGGWLAGFDSIFSNWGDTTGGTAAGDTSGKGGELDALGDSLAGALWGYPCDTTGGQTCDGAYIGVNGLENAKTAWSEAADALGDSLQSGAVNDSVNSWRNKLINNGVLTGDGSATCPAVFNRTWEIPIGRGSSYTFGPFSTMVCHDFGMGLTFWALARILLRAMVAIACMWWLYRAVTGTDGGNNDED